MYFTDTQKLRFYHQHIFTKGNSKRSNLDIRKVVPAGMFEIEEEIQNKESGKYMG